MHQNRAELCTLVALSACALAGHLWNAASGDVTIYPDSAEYIAASRMPLLQVLGGPRAPALPLVIRMLSEDLMSVAAVQCALSGLAFLFLAWCAGSLLRAPAARCTLYAVLLALSFHPFFFRAARCIVSESLSSSLLALGLGALLKFIQATRPVWGLACVAATIAWMFCRDSNVYHGVLFALFIGSWGCAGRDRQRRWSVALAAMLLAGCCLSGALAARAERWRRPLRHVVQDRMEQGEHAEWLIRNGAPSEPDQLDHWLSDHGRRVYARFLLAHPVLTFVKPLGPIAARGAPPPADLVTQYGLEHGPLPDILARALMPPLWVSFFGLLCALAATIRRRAARGTLCALLGIGSFPAFWMIYHADSYEFSRHALPPAQVVTVLFWVCLSVAFAPRGADRDRAPAPTGP